MTTDSWQGGVREGGRGPVTSKGGAAPKTGRLLVIRMEEDGRGVGDRTIKMIGVSGSADGSV
jgi:hypothetical protein